MIFSTCPAGNCARVLRATSLTEKTNTRSGVLAKDGREPRPRISRWVSIKLHARVAPIFPLRDVVLLCNCHENRDGEGRFTSYYRLPSVVVTAWRGEGEEGRTFNETAGKTETNRLFGNSVRELATTGTRRVKLFRCLANEIGENHGTLRLVKTHSTEQPRPFRYPPKGLMLTSVNPIIAVLLLGLLFVDWLPNVSTYRSDNGDPWSIFIRTVRIHVYINLCVDLGTWLQKHNLDRDFIFWIL